MEILKSKCVGYSSDFVHLKVIKVLSLRPI